jgi:hypothetical protein
LEALGTPVMLSTAAVSDNGVLSNRQVSGASQRRDAIIFAVAQTAVLPV